jgi:hypothetical protein
MDLPLRNFVSSRVFFKWKQHEVTTASSSTRRCAPVDRGAPTIAIPIVAAGRRVTVEPRERETRPCGSRGGAVRRREVARSRVSRPAESLGGETK